ncbi:MAG: hypothetical protein J6U64_01355 [Alphaproteobacteria bacterium]|nr:hypothetical protein [Alphaproteobacteria bacterium]
MFNVAHTNGWLVSTAPIECPSDSTGAARAYTQSVTGYGMTGCCPPGTTAQATQYNDASYCCPAGTTAYEGRLGYGHAEYNGSDGAGCCPGTISSEDWNVYCNN